jgi:2-desacetyl-2-hydroxyethyl bacteriochlorophyllide A dehydrogenase
MKVAVYKGIKSIRFEERPIPRAGPGEAVVKIKYCGICGTDMHLYFIGDPMIKPGVVLGHENVGTVYELGEGVTGFKIGDRVVAGPPGSCGKCYYCLHGHPNICVNGFPQTNGLGVDGGMAEYMLVRDARQMLFKIPDNVSFEDAVLTDTIATAYRAITQSAFKLGDNVVVSGAGPIGLSAVQIFRRAGARHITSLEVVAARRKLALQLGADIALDPAAEGDKLGDKISRLYDGIGPDIVVEAAGVPASFELCLTLPRAGGQLLNLGVTGEPSRVVQALMVVKELSIKSSLAYGGEEVQKILHYLSTGKMSTRGIYSGSIPLPDLVEKGFERLSVDKSLIKVAVAP